VTAGAGSPDDLEDASDTGASNSDDVTSDTTPTFAVECVAAGSVVRFYSDVYDTPVGVLGEGEASGSVSSNNRLALAPTFTAPFSGEYIFVRRAQSISGNGNLSVGTTALGVDVYNDTATASRLSSGDLERTDVVVSLEAGVEYFVHAWAGGGSTVTNPSYEFRPTNNMVGFHTCTGAGTESATLDLVDLVDGDHEITYTVSDPAGNESDPSAPLTVTVDG